MGEGKTKMGAEELATLMELGERVKKLEDESKRRSEAIAQASRSIPVNLIL